MWIVTLIGSIAATLTTVAFIPQAIKTLKFRDTAALSLGMYATFTLGVLFWLLYGILKKDPVIVVANIITAALALSILSIKISNLRAGRDRS